MIFKETIVIELLFIDISIRQQTCQITTSTCKLRQFGILIFCNSTLILYLCLPLIIKCPDIQIITRCTNLHLFNLPRCFIIARCTFNLGILIHFNYSSTNRKIIFLSIRYNIEIILVYLYEISMGYWLTEFA